MHTQEFRYFGLQGNWKYKLTLLDPLEVLDLQKLNKNSQEIQNFYGRVRSDMIDKAIDGSITKTQIKKLRLH